MKINCSCGHVIVDSTDYLPTKGHLVADTDYFHFWDAIDDAIEKSGPTAKEKEKAAMQLRQMNVFKTFWECSNCGKLYTNGKNGDLISYSSDDGKYHGVLDGRKG